MKNRQDQVTSPKGVFDSTLEYFKDRVREGQFKPGDRLLPERTMCSELGISRSSLREVLRVLEIFGITTSIPGQGSYILSPRLSSHASFFEMMLFLNQGISENVLEVRILMECEAVRLAAKRATPEELFSLKRVVERMPLKLKEENFGAQADFEFHKIIMQATHNDIIIFISEAIEGYLRKSHYERRIALFKAKKQIRDQLVAVHRNVYKALESGDASLAAAKMREHFNYTNKILAEQGDSLLVPDIS